MIIRRKIDIGKNEFYRAISFDGNNSIINNWEKTFANYIGTRYAITTSSGRAAMIGIIKYLKIGKGDELIVPAYTLKDLIPLIQDLGIKVITADIDKDSFNIDPKSIIKKITPKTKAILAAHIFGNPCAIEEIQKIAKTHKIHIIEDCAHSVGASVDGKMTGSFGIASIFSFENIKPINTYGGGMVTTNDEKLKEYLEKNTQNNQTESNSGVIKKIVTAYLENTLVHSPLSYPALVMMAGSGKEIVTKLYRKIQGTPKVAGAYRPLQAQIGLNKFKTLEFRIEKRKQIAAYYAKNLLTSIVPQKTEKNSKHNYYFYVARLPVSSKNIKKTLIKKGIDVGILDEITDNCAIELDKKKSNINNVYQNNIQLPMHEGLSQKDLNKIVKEINKCIK